MCEFAIKPIWIGSAICTIGLCIATPAKAQITLRLSMNPSSVSFPDANPSTTPLSVRWDGQGSASEFETRSRPTTGPSTLWRRVT